MNNHYTNAMLVLEAELKNQRKNKVIVIGNGNSGKSLAYQLAKNNCTEIIKLGISETDREKASKKLGPNWATVLSGLGDQ